MSLNKPTLSHQSEPVVNAEQILNAKKILDFDKERQSAQNLDDQPLLNVDLVVKRNLPRVDKSAIWSTPTKKMLRYLFNEKQCNQIASNFAHLSGVDFVEQVLMTLNVSYRVPSNEIENIPYSGKVMIYANHPIGSLDALVLIKMISQIRPDIKVVANELLMAIKPLQNILLPVRNMTGGTPKQHLNEIQQHLQADGAVLIFPSGEVSRLRPSGVTDLKWQTGFLRIAKTCQAPLLPIFVDAKNSAAFYSASMLYKPLASLLLVKEMFKQQNQVISIKVGEVIPIEAVSLHDTGLKTLVNRLKSHLYRIGNNRSGLFSTQKAISHPEPRQSIQSEFAACEQLGTTPDGKQIYLYRHQQSSAIMREIGRLREVAFRSFGEGTGQRRDIDKYDNHYLHLVLWDKLDLEIVGAYRLAPTDRLQLSQLNSSSLTSKTSIYSQTLFNYHPSFALYFEQGIELGRSFVQPKYWGKRSLEYLWLGIGAFLAKHPQYRYLFGPVSLSDSYPEQAKQMLVYFYRHHFADHQQLASSVNPYVINQTQQSEFKTLFNGQNYAENFKILKGTLTTMGVSVPTLYKQYGELCEGDGVKFIDFGTDPDFGDCIDGLVLVDIHQLKPIKKQKYLATY